MAHNTKRSAARQAVETLERPEGISACKWRGVKATLLAIADFYPKAYPSQRILAEKVGCDLRTIQRYVALAKANGLLLVKADAGMKGRNNSWSRTNQYLIVNTTECREPLTTENRPNPSGTTYPPGELRSSHSPSESSLSVEAAKFDPEGQSRQVGPTAKVLPAKKPPRRPDLSELVVDGGRRMRSDVPSNAPRPPKSPPWRQIAGDFLGEWDTMVTLTAKGDYLRTVRPADTIGHFQRYLTAHFFGKDALTPKSVAEVMALIDQFVEDVYRGRVRIKEGQSAWMAFTGAWGRKPDRSITTTTNSEYVPPQRRA